MSVCIIKLVSGLRQFAPFITMPSAPTPPPLTLRLFFDFCKPFFMSGPSFDYQHDSPSNLAESLGLPNQRKIESPGTLVGLKKLSRTGGPETTDLRVDPSKSPAVACGCNCSQCFWADMHSQAKPVVNANLPDYQQTYHFPPNPSLSLGTRPAAVTPPIGGVKFMSSLGVLYYASRVPTEVSNYRS